MANARYIVDNTDRGDATVFTIPGDEDGGAGDASFRVEDQGLNTSHDSYVHIDNGWDANVDVTLQGSHLYDEAMASAADDGSTITVVSDAVDFFDVTSSHSYLEVSVEPAATPTSGTLTVTFQSREA